MTAPIVRQKKALTFETNSCIHVVDRPTCAAVSLPAGSGLPIDVGFSPAGESVAESQRVVGNLLAPARLFASQPEIVTIQRCAIERLRVEDRSGVVRLRVTETQAAMLIDRRLVETRGRATVIALRLKPGVSVAAINVALRVGIRDRLPKAEDSNTVKREVVRGGLVFEPIHVAAWDDGRILPPGLGGDAED